MWAVHRRTVTAGRQYWLDDVPKSPNVRMYELIIINIRVVGCGSHVDSYLSFYLVVFGYFGRVACFVQIRQAGVSLGAACFIQLDLQAGVSIVAADADGERRKIFQSLESPK